ncbi:hypothetical protein OIDMADRAFT_107106 [Oidiodendron maius Zn]|uniref:Major facilitator superfamily (MFS) profile domain-containing protein n=1 Tax=Oidiodendron maius (strain Zn) TaxID=913774 RepID=A0A0C3GLX5_OIDMZ|nr:hypothetical protein OIDMADRAFT_107106 [Oidiodendron maius Zn]
MTNTQERDSTAPVQHAGEEHVIAAEPLTHDQVDKWWFQDGGLLRLYFLIFIAVLSSATNGYDGSMMNGLQTLTYWQDYFHNPHGSTQGLLNAIQSVGGVCALPFAPNLSDKLGRKKTIFIGCLIVALGVGLQSGARNIGMFIAGRYFIGMGSGISAVASPLLITELCHPQQRGKLTAVYNTFWYFGSTIAAWTTFGTLQLQSNLSWRLPSLFQFIPSFIQVVLIWFLPESPRFLISRDQNEKALAIMTKYHANGNPESEWLRFEFSEIRASLRLEKESAKSQWKDLFKTPGNRRRMLICISCGLFSQLSGTGLVSYYLGKVLNDIGITDPTFQNKINGIYAVTNWVEASGAAFLVDRFGRRPLFLLSNSVMVCTFAIWIALTAIQNRTGSASIGSGVICMIFFHSFFYNIVWVSLNVAYPAEILPYHLRAKGLTVLNLSISCALFFGQYVNPIGIERLGWKYYIFYEVWLVIELIIVFFFFIETQGSTLEEISQTFDGKEAVENVKVLALEKANYTAAEEYAGRV